MPGIDPAGAAPPALKLAHVRRSFRAGKRVVTALDGITAEAARGAVTGLIGPDGAGKTTLMRLIAGLLRADTGRIEVLGTDVARDPLAVQARLGYMPQRFGLYEDLSVAENLDLYADLQGVRPADRAARYAELLHMTGLGRFTARIAGRLSGGMKQKLGLACTLVRPPDLLLLDEPTVGVDPVSRRELWQIIGHLTREAHMTVVFSTAYLDEAERCDSVLLIHEGRLLGHGEPGRFSAEMAGRSFFATARLGRRRLQARLAEAPGVIDAVIQGSRVRVVTAEAAPPVAAGLVAEAPDLVLTPTPPRFEDSFVARLRVQVEGGVRVPGTPQRPSPQQVRLPQPAPASGRGGMAGDVISVAHLTRRFGAFVAVDDVSFTVARGEIFGLLGANGAGKSTTFRMLCGLLPASAGTLHVAGFDLHTAAASARGRIGYMAQRFSLYGDLSVAQNLRFFSSAYRLSGTRQRARIDWAETEFELGPMWDATARDLPLGFKQRLALACALMHEPDILFLDEPTSGVDPLMRREFWRRINALAEAGVTVLVTTHFMEEAEYCDQLVIMAQGKVLAVGEPEAIKRAARTEAQPDPTMEDAFIAVIEAPAPPMHTA
ncbi:MAG TPA: ATP-binding cassette domain-containing protein [Acetobacteraceae bacterium]|nr:ATP-binding cassette domain-containing protein [Acetobacteraceae bacterium]